ncbi:zinc finger protein 567-like [Stegodyphus dumicola]|uniref:zinc finger protein 567-like n=1 Tax=Stegodyphus dumicola TaxID=202533 RepID=UPI0015AE3FDD|nr:zinc finger protein 567-like [Stegodyphus dumicola]
MQMLIGVTKTIRSDTSLNQESCEPSSGHETGNNSHFSLDVLQHPSSIQAVPELSVMFSPETRLNSSSKTCRYCGKDFLFQSRLKRHLYVHTGERPFVCQFCGKKFNQKASLGQHLLIHSTVKPFVCRGSNAELYIFDTEPPNNNITKTQGNLVNTHTPKSQAPINASQKSDKQSKRSSLDEKAEVIYMEVDSPYLPGDSSSMDNVWDYSSTSSPVPSSPKSKDVFDSLLTADQRTSDKRTHEGFASCVSQHSFPYAKNAYVFSQDSSIYKSGPFMCQICNKAFRSRTSLAYHCNIHTGERPYACDICGKRFKQKGALGQHKSVHSAERPYKCNHCGKSFNRKYSAFAHSMTHYN